MLCTQNKLVGTQNKTQNGIFPILWILLNQMVFKIILKNPAVTPAGTFV